LCVSNVDPDAHNHGVTPTLCEDSRQFAWTRRPVIRSCVDHYVIRPLEAACKIMGAACPARGEASN